MEKYNEEKYKDKNITFSLTKTELLLYNSLHNTNIQDEKLLTKQYVKISLSNVEIKNIINIFSQPENIDFLKRNLIYFYDFDATLDIAGCFNKKELINIMINKFNFYTENNNTEIYENEKHLNKMDLDENKGLILKNNKTVGNHCLSFIYNISNNKNIRCKFYNKFIDNAETLGTSCNMGCNLKNWAYNETDNRLQQTILMSKELGLLRLETTFKFLPNIDDINEVNNILFNILQEAKKTKNYFYCSISNQWINYLKNIKENLILVNTTDRDIYFIKSINLLTKKINGLYITGKVGRKKLSGNKNNEVFKSNLCKIVSYLTFKNLPVNLINIIKDKKDKNINSLILNINIYKISMDLNPLSEFMFLTNGKLVFNNTIKKYKEGTILKDFNYKHKLTDTGLIDYENYKFFIPEKDDF